MDHDYAMELLGAYALPACDDLESAELEFHLVVCAECAVESAGLRDLVERLNAMTDRPGGPKNDYDPSSPGVSDE